MHAYAPSKKKRLEMFCGVSLRRPMIQVTPPPQKKKNLAWHVWVGPAIWAPPPKRRWNCVKQHGKNLKHGVKRSFLGGKPNQIESLTF